MREPVTCIMAWKSESEKQRKKRLDKSMPEMVKVVPSEILVHLTCLSSSAKEKVHCDERNYGPTEAARNLFMIDIRKREGWYEQLVEALRETGYDHQADLLEGPEKHFKTGDHKTSGEDGPSPSQPPPPHNTSQVATTSCDDPDRQPGKRNMVQHGGQHASNPISELEASVTPIHVHVPKNVDDPDRGHTSSTSLGPADTEAAVAFQGKEKQQIKDKQEETKTDRPVSEPVDNNRISNTEATGIPSMHPSSPEVAPEKVVHRPTSLPIQGRSNEECVNQNQNCASLMHQARPQNPNAVQNDLSPLKPVVQMNIKPGTSEECNDGDSTSGQETSPDSNVEKQRRREVSRHDTCDSLNQSWDGPKTLATLDYNPCDKQALNSLKSEDICISEKTINTDERSNAAEKTGDTNEESNKAADQKSWFKAGTRAVASAVLQPVGAVVVNTIGEMLFQSQQI